MDRVEYHALWKELRGRSGEITTILRIIKGLDPENYKNNTVMLALRAVDEQIQRDALAGYGAAQR